MIIGANVWLFEEKKIRSKGGIMKGVCWYFAYGSNLLPERMFRRCPTACLYAPAVLPNYQITERLYADVDYRPGKKVEGFLYVLRPRDILSLDRFEGVPRIYKRYTVDVRLDDGTEISALVYEMTEETKAMRNGCVYPEEYRQICMEGALFHKIKNNFIRKRNKRK